MRYQDLKPGDELPELVKDPINKVQLLKYAGASGDYNLIHIDIETAKAVGLPGIIAHGMLSMGFLGQYLAGIAGPEAVKRLKVRFQSMVFLGDVLTCRAKVKEIRPEADGSRAVVTVDVWAENQDGTKVTAGEGEIVLAG